MPSPSEARQHPAEPARNGGGDPAAAVRARGIARRYGEGESAVQALRAVDLDVQAKALTAVMGPSGSGKSTLMHVLAGLDRPTEGTVEVMGEQITTMGDKQLTELRRSHVGFVFQFFNLVPVLSAEENIVLPLQLAGTHPADGWVDELIDRVGLSDRRTHRPSELSGGQQQRAAIARALVGRPSIVFADEPTGNLDSTSSAEIMTLMRGTTDELGQTTLMVTHDPVAAATADRVVFIADGTIAGDLRDPDEQAILAGMQELSR
ncbi:MAG: ABC transporter ATP-binding protein [Solirubrobacterales bacterium]